MKTKITLLVFAFFLAVNTSFAQNEECMNKLSIMTEYAKAKNYDAAYQPFMELRQTCPKFNRAIYKYGEKILAYKIKKSSGSEQVAFINDLIKMWDERAQYFASKTPKGKYGAKKCQLMFDNKAALGKSDQELYDCFDGVFKADRKNFSDPKSILTYFKLMVALYDSGKQPAQALFDKYDDMVDKVEEEVNTNSKKLNALVAKEDAGTTLSKKEARLKTFYEQMLTAYSKISKSLDGELGERANCSNLIPLYQKDYEANKNNAQWLQRAMNKMYSKGCKEDPMFLKLVQQKNSIEPNADTAFYLYLLTGEQRYFDQTVQLETDPFKKAKLYKKIAKDFKAKGSYGKARQYYREALKLNPSDGSSHIKIAEMYAKSANKCGDTNFNKRATFWLAAQEARKAGRVDPTLKSYANKVAASYEAKAPSKSEIFSAGNAGQTIRIGCWIGASVTVPKI